MQILAIEPVGFRGHMAFNAYFLRCFGEIGNVTFVAPCGYLDSCAVDSRMDIPTRLLQHNSKLGGRWYAIHVLNYILRNIQVADYDAIVFLAYETISFSLRWIMGGKVFLFEHNNIENSLGNWIKTFFYRHLSHNVTHLTFQGYIAQYIRNTYGRRAICVPFPYYRSDVSDSRICAETNAMPSSSEKRKIIFSPSGSTPQVIQDKLKEFVETNKGAYYAICKGNPSEKSDDWEVRSFFEDYESLMRVCDSVFVGARFRYRVSSVVYEALSYGKPVFLMDSLFAQNLQKEYPHLVFPINNVNDILRLETDSQKMREEHARFLREHSFSTILAKMEFVFREG